MGICYCESHEKVVGTIVRSCCKCKKENKSKNYLKSVSSVTKLKTARIVDTIT